MSVTSQVDGVGLISLGLCTLFGSLKWQKKFFLKPHLNRGKRREKKLIFPYLSNLCSSLSHKHDLFYIFNCLFPLPSPDIFFCCYCNLFSFCKLQSKERRTDYPWNHNDLRQNINILSERVQKIFSYKFMLLHTISFILESKQETNCRRKINTKGYLFQIEIQFERKTEML